MIILLPGPMRFLIPDLPSANAIHPSMIPVQSAVLETCLLKNCDHRILLSRFSKLAAKLDHPWWRWPKTPEQFIAYCSSFLSWNGRCQDFFLRIHCPPFQKLFLLIRSLDFSLKYHHTFQVKVILLESSFIELLNIKLQFTWLQQQHTVWLNWLNCK